MLTLLFTLAAQAQQIKRVPRISPGLKPACAAGAICFSGEVFSEKEFRHPINSTLDFVLEPGWTISVVPKQAQGECEEFASVVNSPYRAHRQLYIDMAYGWTAEDEVNNSPREFLFVTNCPDYRAESARLNIVLWGHGHTDEEYNQAVAKLGSSPLGEGRLWITKYKITHTGDTAEDKSGKIEWMQFAVEIKLPKS